MNIWTQALIATHASESAASFFEPTIKNCFPLPLHQKPNHKLHMYKEILDSHNLRCENNKSMREQKRMRDSMADSNIGGN
jgi:hypothetical protein